MLTQATIIALLVLSIWYTMQEDEIFGFVRDIRVGKRKGYRLRRPIYEYRFFQAVGGCNVCMTPWYGSALYWIIPWKLIPATQPATLWQWPIVVIVAMGVNIVINKLEVEK